MVQLESQSKNVSVIGIIYRYSRRRLIAFLISMLLFLLLIIGIILPLMLINQANKTIPGKFIYNFIDFN